MNSDYPAFALGRGAVLPSLVALALLLGATPPARSEPPTGGRPAAQPTAQATVNTAAVPGLPADWQQQWDALVAAAQQEGKVVVYGPPTAEMRTDLPAAFKKRFGIDMEYNGLEGPVYSARLASERAAGVYTADAALNGSDSMYRIIAGEGKVENGTMGMAVPLRPLLILPEVLDPTKYRNGKLWFMDPRDQYVLRVASQISVPMYVNTQYIAPSRLKSWYDLLKPEYQGKIVSYDPTVAGAALALASTLNIHLGRDYVRKLYGEQAFLSRDHRQVGDLLARGSHPIALSLQSQEGGRLIREGQPVAEIPGLADAPSTIGGGYGLLGLLDRAPHPNAAKLFVNWLASREGSQVFQDAQLQLSTRSDVDASSFADYEIPKPGVEYADTYGWDYVLEQRAGAQRELAEMLGRRGG